MRKMIIMRGLPASGKSTAAHELYRAANKVANAHICSADDYFWRDVFHNGDIIPTYDFDPTKLGAAHARCMSKAIEVVFNHPDGEWYTDRAKDEWDVTLIIDNTNTQLWEFEAYLELAKACDFEVEVRRINTDLEICLARNADRDEDRRVPSETILRMWERFEPYSGAGEVEEPYEAVKELVEPHFDYPPLKPGTAVRTVEGAPSSDWMAVARVHARAGRDGVVGEHHDGHGLCYDVTHGDGTKACYNEDELVATEPHGEA